MSVEANKRTAEAFYDLLFNPIDPWAAIDRCVGDKYGAFLPAIAPSSTD